MARCGCGTCAPTRSFTGITSPLRYVTASRDTAISTTRGKLNLMSPAPQITVCPAAEQPGHQSAWPVRYWLWMPCAHLEGCTANQGKGLIARLVRCRAVREHSLITLMAPVSFHNTCDCVSATESGGAHVPQLNAVMCSFGRVVHSRCSRPTSGMTLAAAVWSVCAFVPTRMCWV